MTNAERQRKYRAKHKMLTQIKDKKRKADRVDKEGLRWTKAQFFLERADGNDFDDLDTTYCSFGPDEFRSVGPTHGPFHEPNPVLARKMFARACITMTNLV
ncbi:MAG: hypothetical protein FVQ82_02635 [Planctomycetes bacterium]|nr:hypothetical protein [Planctomycetota bacterium]